MSTFLIHQEPHYTVVLADSLGTKGSELHTGRSPLTAPKLVHVAPFAYAAHAGTWQPALAMLSKLRPTLLAIETEGSTPDWNDFASAMTTIGRETYADFQHSFKLETFDVRVALVLTGILRHPDDIASNSSSSLIHWELANNFAPQRASGTVSFGGSPPLTDLAAAILHNEFVRETMRQSPLACAQSLIAAHAALSKLSTSISSDANVIVCGEGGDHAIIHGNLLTLPNSALLLG